MSNFQNSGKDSTEWCRGIELKGQFVQIVEQFYYLDDKVETRRSTVDNILARAWDEWSKMRDI